ncbi:MAG TPA: bacteriohopanetetrol glucosamine biosynthesis glycosyltransferase HpnI [Xanthobacteraceae bacterium]|jgi:ceramide glucosyltransferase
MSDANTILQSFGELCAAGVILGVLYNLTAAILVLRFPRPTELARGSYPAVSILKPLHGNEPGLFWRLASFCRQDYPAAIQLICGTQSESDPVIDLVTLLTTTQPSTQVDLKMDAREHGTNRKVSNLVNMQAAARHEVVLISDSDIVVEPRFLSNAISELQAPGVGGVSCAYFGIAAGGIWAKLSALYINTQFLPNVITALSFDAARPCFGSAILMRRSMLDRIGGLGTFADELADDFAIGRAIRATGYRVSIPRFAVGHVCFEREFRSFWERQMRSARTIRSIDPVGYVGTIFMHPFTLALLAATIGMPHPALMIATAVACRVVLCSCVERAFGLPRQPYWLVPLHDLISFAVFVTSFLGSAVVWRGHIYRVLADGALKQDRS